MEEPKQKRKRRRRPGKAVNIKETLVTNQLFNEEPLVNEQASVTQNPQNTPAVQDEIDSKEGLIDLINSMCSSESQSLENTPFGASAENDFKAGLIEALNKFSSVTAVRSNINIKKELHPAEVQLEISRKETPQKSGNMAAFESDVKKGQETCTTSQLQQQLLNLFDKSDSTDQNVVSKNTVEIGRSMLDELNTSIETLLEPIPVESSGGAQVVKRAPKRFLVPNVFAKAHRDVSAMEVLKMNKDVSTKELDSSSNIEEMGTSNQDEPNTCSRTPCVPEKIPKTAKKKSSKKLDSSITAEKGSPIQDDMNISSETLIETTEKKTTSEKEPIGNLVASKSISETGFPESKVQKESCCKTSVESDSSVKIKKTKLTKNFTEVEPVKSNVTSSSLNILEDKSSEKQNNSIKTTEIDTQKESAARSSVETLLSLVDTDSEDELREQPKQWKRIRESNQTKEKSALSSFKIPKKTKIEAADSSKISTEIEKEKKSDTLYKTPLNPSLDGTDSEHGTRTGKRLVRIKINGRRVRVPADQVGKFRTQAREQANESAKVSNISETLGAHLQNSAPEREGNVTGRSSLQSNTIANDFPVSNPVDQNKNVQKPFDAVESSLNPFLDGTESEHGTKTGKRFVRIKINGRRVRVPADQVEELRKQAREQANESAKEPNMSETLGAHLQNSAPERERNVTGNPSLKSNTIINKPQVCIPVDQDENNVPFGAVDDPTDNLDSVTAVQEESPSEKVTEDESEFSHNSELDYLELKTEFRKHHTNQLRVLEELDEWRHSVASSNDVDVEAVLRVTKMKRLAVELPHSMEILACTACSPYVLQSREHVFKIINPGYRLGSLLLSYPTLKGRDGRRIRKMIHMQQLKEHKNLNASNELDEIPRELIGMKTGETNECLFSSRPENNLSRAQERKYRRAVNRLMRLEERRMFNELNAFNELDEIPQQLSAMKTGETNKSCSNKAEGAPERGIKKWNPTQAENQTSIPPIECTSGGALNMNPDFGLGSLPSLSRKLRRSREKSHRRSLNRLKRLEEQRIFNELSASSQLDERPQQLSAMKTGETNKSCSNKAEGAPERGITKWNPTQAEDQTSIPPIECTSGGALNMNPDFGLGSLPSLSRKLRRSREKSHRRSLNRLKRLEEQRIFNELNASSELDERPQQLSAMKTGETNELCSKEGLERGIEKSYPTQIENETRILSIECTRGGVLNEFFNTQNQNSLIQPTLAPLVEVLTAQIVSTIGRGPYRQPVLQQITSPSSATNGNVTAHMVQTNSIGPNIRGNFQNCNTNFPQPVPPPLLNQPITTFQTPSNFIGSNFNSTYFQNCNPSYSVMNQLNAVTTGYPMTQVAPTKIHGSNNFNNTNFLNSNCNQYSSYVPSMTNQAYETSQVFPVPQNSVNLHQHLPFNIDTAQPPPTHVDINSGGQNLNNYHQTHLIPTDRSQSHNSHRIDHQVISHETQTAPFHSKTVSGRSFTPMPIKPDSSRVVGLSDYDNMVLRNLSPPPSRIYRVSDRNVLIPGIRGQVPKDPSDIVKFSSDEDTGSQMNSDEENYLFPAASVSLKPKSDDIPPHDHRRRDSRSSSSSKSSYILRKDKDNSSQKRRSHSRERRLRHRNRSPPSHSRNTRGSSRSRRHRSRSRSRSRSRDRRRKRSSSRDRHGSYKRYRRSNSKEKDDRIKEIVRKLIDRSAPF